MICPPMPPCKPPKGKTQKPKIVQFQAMPNDGCWQGMTLCLGDDGVLYIENDKRELEPYLYFKGD